MLPARPVAPSTRLGGVEGGTALLGWGWVHSPRTRPCLPSLCQRPPTVHLRQSVPVGREGRLLGPAGLRSVLDGAPHRQPGPVAARHPVLPAEGVLSPAKQVGRTKGATASEGPPVAALVPAEGHRAGPLRSSWALPPWGSRPSLTCLLLTHPNKELFNCSELRLPSPTPSPGAFHEVHGHQDKGRGGAEVHPVRSAPRRWGVVGHCQPAPPSLCLRAGCRWQEHRGGFCGLEGRAPAALGCSWERPPEGGLTRRAAPDLCQHRSARTDRVGLFKFVKTFTQVILT